MWKMKNWINILKFILEMLVVAIVLVFLWKISGVEPTVYERFIIVMLSLIYFEK